MCVLKGNVTKSMQSYEKGV